jgi:L-lactate dehydrogenase complex protein LldE
MISAAMGDAKAGYAENCGAEFLTSTDPSCLMQIEGVLRRRKSRVRTIHLANILARTEDETALSDNVSARESNR